MSLHFIPVCDEVVEAVKQGHLADGVHGLVGGAAGFQRDANNEVERNAGLDRLWAVSHDCMQRDKYPALVDAVVPAANKSAVGPHVSCVTRGRGVDQKAESLAMTKIVIAPNDDLSCS